MSFRVAQVDEKGAILRIINERDGSVDLGDRRIAFRHIKTWVKQNDQMLARYSLVGITTPAQPAYNPKTHLLRLVPVEVGATSYADTWEVIARPSEEVRNQLIEVLKDKAWTLWGRSSWSKGRTAWFDHRDALKTRGLEILAAFDQGREVDAEAGTIEGAGGWPT